MFWDIGVNVKKLYEVKPPLVTYYIYACLFAFHIENLARKTLINDISDLMIEVSNL